MTGDRIEEHDDQPRDEDPVGGGRVPGGGPGPAADEFLLELDELDDDLFEAEDLGDADDPLDLEGLFEAFTPESSAMDAAPELVGGPAAVRGGDLPSSTDEGLKFDPNEREEDPFELDEIEVVYLDRQSGSLESEFELEAMEFVIDDDDDQIVALDPSAVASEPAQVEAPQDGAEDLVALIETQPAADEQAAPAFQLFDLDLDPEAAVIARDDGAGDEGASDDSWSPLAGASAAGPMLPSNDDADAESGAETQEFDFSGFAAELEASRNDADEPEPTAPDWASSDFTIAAGDEPLAAEESFTAAGFGLDTRSDAPAWSRTETDPSAWGTELAVDPEEESDPIYGDLQGEAGEAAAADAWDEHSERAAEVDEELSQLLTDAVPPPLRIVGGFRGGHRVGRRLAAAAVLLVTIGGAGVAVAPEWFGLAGTAPTIEHVVVKRPRIDVNLPPPIDPELPSEVPLEVPTQAPVVVEAGPVDPPVDPPVEVPPLEGPLVAENDPPPPAPDAPPAAALTPNFSPLMVGEFLEVVAAVAEEPTVGPGNLPIGTRALALMRNDEIFIGVVRRMDAVNVTLDLEPGEVSLALASMTRIQPLNSAESDQTIEAERGFVRLKNSTRFYGRVLRDPEDGTLIVQGDRNRIVLLRDDVAAYGSAGSSHSNVVFEDDDEWLDERVRRQLDQMGHGALPKVDDGGQDPEGTTSTQTVVPPSTPVRGGR